MAPIVASQAAAGAAPAVQIADKANVCKLYLVNPLIASASHCSHASIVVQMSWISLKDAPSVQRSSSLFEQLLLYTLPQTSCDAFIHTSLYW
eukprot:m.171911 g.171911  ORF g.171911 m.171911 type:complete len:92 (-) comp16509_c5_seq1:143-418(-)